MSRKSVKETKRANKEPVKKEPASISEKKVKNRLPDLYVYAGLVLLFLFSLYLRAIKPMSRVFIGDTVRLDGNDPWYHMMLAKSVVLNHQRPWFDPLTVFPQGTSIHFGPFNSWGIAILSYIRDLGTPSLHSVEVAGAFFPAILGALLIFPVYFIGKELAGRSGGFMAAIMVAVLPGQILSRSVLGFCDHHISEVLLSTTMMLFFMLAIKTGQNKLTFNALRRGKWSSLKTPLAYSLLSGLFLGLYIDAWSSGHLFIGILLLFIVAQSVIDHIKGTCVEYLGVTGAITFTFALLMVLPFVNYYGFSTSLYSLFQPTMLILGAISVLLLSFFSRYLSFKKLDAYYFPVIIVASVVVGFLLLYFLAPQFVGQLMSGLRIFLPKVGGAGTVAEISPILERGAVYGNFPGLGLVSILSPFWLAFLALILMIYRYYRDGDQRQNSTLAFLIWTAVILALAFAQNRFAYYYAINVALLTGFLAYLLLEQTRFREFEDTLIKMVKGKSDQDLDLNKTILNVGAISFLALIFVIPSMFSMGVVEDTYVRGSYYSETYITPPSPDWYDSMLWLKGDTPDPGMDIYTIYERPPKGEKFQYPDTAYGVMSWWDYGHWIEGIGQRFPNANPFQQGIGNKTTGAPGSSPFFLAQSEMEAEKVLAELDENRSPYYNTKYVVTDIPMAMTKFHAIAAWSGEHVSDYQFYTMQGNQPVQIFRIPYFKSMVARLHFFDGSEASVGEAWAISFRPDERGMASLQPLKVSTNYSELLESVNQSVAQGYPAEIISQIPLSSAVPLEALKHYRLVYESQSLATVTDQKYVKIFEHVPGAEIKGSAPAGTEVSISVPVMTNQGRTFLYKQSAVSDGEFSLIVPYSTEGPIEGGTNFLTKPAGPYSLVVGDDFYEVRVPEEMVMSGGSTQI